MYGRIKPFVPPYHVQGFNRHSLKIALGIAGFDILHLRDFGGNYTFWKGFKFLSWPYMRELILFPISLLSIPLKRQIQLEALVSIST